MKIAYIINWELSLNDGVSKKVYAQTQEWLHLGHVIKIFYIYKKQVFYF